MPQREAFPVDDVEQRLGDDSQILGRSETTTRRYLALSSRVAHSVRVDWEEGGSSLELNGGTPAVSVLSIHRHTAVFLRQVADAIDRECEQHEAARATAREEPG